MDGVKLASTDSAVITSLDLMLGMRVRVPACRTCRERFGLIDSLAVDQISTMNEIAGLLPGADRVVFIWKSDSPCLRRRTQGRRRRVSEEALRARLRRSLPPPGS
jgi:hypothetical protein